MIIARSFMHSPRQRRLGTIESLRAPMDCPRATDVRHALRYVVRDRVPVLVRPARQGLTDSRRGVLRNSNRRARVFRPAAATCQAADATFPDHLAARRAAYSRQPGRSVLTRA